jgi:hypothetical protein
LPVITGGLESKTNLGYCSVTPDECWRAWGLKGEKAKEEASDMTGNFLRGILQKPLSPLSLSTNLTVYLAATLWLSYLGI